MCGTELCVDKLYVTVSVLTNVACDGVRVPRVCVKSAAAPLFQVNDEPQQLRVLCLSEALVAFAVAFQANGDGIGMPWLCLEDAKWLQKIGGRS